jgi:hypothetical protein
MSRARTPTTTKESAPADSLATGEPSKRSSRHPPLLVLGTENPHPKDGVHEVNSQAAGEPSNRSSCHPPSPVSSPRTPRVPGVLVGSTGVRTPRSRNRSLPQQTPKQRESRRHVDAGVCASRLPSDWSIDQLLQSPSSLSQPTRHNAVSVCVLALA